MVGGWGGEGWSKDLTSIIFTISTEIMPNFPSADCLLIWIQRLLKIINLPVLCSPLPKDNLHLLDVLKKVVHAVYPTMYKYMYNLLIGLSFYQEVLSLFSLFLSFVSLCEFLYACLSVCMAIHSQSLKVTEIDVYGPH